MKAWFGKTFPMLLVLTLIANACVGEEKKSSPPHDSRLMVVTTVAPITSIVENVAGDNIQLTGIIPEGMNSHTFEPIPSDIKIIAAADLFMLNGLDLETPTLKLVHANKKSIASILLLGNNTITDKDLVFDFSFPKEQGHPNPHLWLNPEYAMQYARLVRDEFIRLDPENQTDYEQNTARFFERLSALDRAIAKAAKTIPERNRRLLTYHDSWPYFARRYGFEVIGAAQPANFSDPSPREVARLIDQIRREKVPAIFGSQIFPSPVLEQIAREAKTKYVDKLRDDELPGKPGDPQHSYIGMMLENTVTMIEALGGSTEPLKKIDPSPVAGSYADYRVKK